MRFDSTTMGMARGLALALATVTLGWLATGCRTYEQQSRSMRQAYAGGQFDLAARQAATGAEAPDAKDYLIWRLEEGAVLRAGGKTAESVQAFERAAETLEKFDWKADVLVGAEAGALLSNQANLPYRGRSYDAIMLNVYQALNQIQLGDLQAARVALVRAYERQKDAVAEHASKIEKTQAEVDARAEKEQIQRSANDPAFQAGVQSAVANLEGVQVYADYVNPFAVYLDGLFFLTQASDPADLERARKSLERAAAFAPQNEWVKQDFELAQQVAGSQALAPTVYVIFETGVAPYRDQIRIDIPILITDVSYVGAAFPKLAMVDNYVPYLEVQANGETRQTQLVASMDSVVATDFKNELPLIITKTVASTVIKAAAAYAINDQAGKQQGDVAQIVARIGTAAYQAAVNIADLRTWTTLPKQFQVCRLPMPPDRALTLRAPGDAVGQPVTLGDGQICVVYAKSVSATAPLQLSQMKLK